MVARCAHGGPGTPSDPRPGPRQSRASIDVGKTGGEGRPPEPLLFIDTCTAQTGGTLPEQRLGYVVLRNIRVSASAIHLVRDTQSLPLNCSRIATPRSENEWAIRNCEAWRR